jgi:hypothetical protein
MSNTIEKKLENYGMALENGLNHPFISRKLPGMGYDKKKIREGISMWEEVMELESLKDDGYTHRHDTAEALKVDCEAAHQLYIRHITYSRLAYKGDAGNWKKLKLTGKRKGDLTGWTAQARAFYRNVMPVAGALNKMGIPTEELQEARDMILAIGKTRTRLKQKVGEAQWSTQKRNKAMKKLDVWMQRYIKVAKLALEEDNQLLEVLGIVVKA